MNCWCTVGYMYPAPTLSLLVESSAFRVTQMLSVPDCTNGFYNGEFANYR